MTSAEKVKLTNALYSEYRKTAIKKTYQGPRRSLNGKEGLSWRSQILGRQCFLPLKTVFSIDTVIVVDPKHLVNK